MTKIFRLLLVAALIVISGFWFVNRSKNRALNSEGVHLRQQPGDNARPDSAQNDTQPQEIASNGGDQSRAQPDSVAQLPTSETISRNPTTGVVAAGNGKFELYRQGDLTFRLNTETGEACVLLASEAEWRKSIVYDHGCNSH